MRIQGVKLIEIWLKQAFKSLAHLSLIKLFLHDQYAAYFSLVIPLSPKSKIQ